MKSPRASPSVLVIKYQTSVFILESANEISQGSALCTYIQGVIKYQTSVFIPGYQNGIQLFVGVQNHSESVVALFTHSPPIKVSKQWLENPSERESTCGFSLVLISLSP